MSENSNKCLMCDAATCFRGLTPLLQILCINVPVLVLLVQLVRELGAGRQELRGCTFLY